MSIHQLLRSGQNRAKFELISIKSNTLWGPNRFWPGSGLVLRCLGPGFTVLALGPGFRPIFIHSFKVVVDGRHKNQSGLFHYLSGARAAPGVAKGRYLFGFLGRFSAENDYGTVHFFELFDKFFEKTVRRQNLEILTEHKPAWIHVTRTPAKS